MVATMSGREPVQIVEIKQPFCSRVFGEAPCTASGDRRCYNTRATCQDTPNFLLGGPLSLFFSSGDVAEQSIDGAPYIIPSLQSVSTSPAQINLAGSSPDAQGLGNRAICSVVFRDHKHTDRRVDPYLDTRDFDPFADDRGSFWSRWIARNKYWQKVQIVVYEGYGGQALSEMVSRTYFCEDVSGPDSSGKVTIRGKDVLAQVEDRKAQAPVASPGVLYEDISASQTSFEVANAVDGEYAASGVLRIGREIVTYTSVATSTNGLTFSGVTRGQFNTDASAHSFDAGVQQCLRYENQRADDVLSDLLTTYGGVDPTWLDTANWASEFNDFLSFYFVDTLITTPESVSKLVSELAINVGFYIWWDERLSLVKFKAIRGVDSVPPLLTDRNHIVSGSFALSAKPRERASQVWIYYTQNDYVQSATDPGSFASQFVIADLESEGEDLYGEKSIRKIFARWLPTGALAQNTASKVITRYVDIPSQVKFDLDAKDRQYWLGDTVRISHHLDVDQYGERNVRRWTITSAEEIVPGEMVRYVAEDTTLYGRIYYIMADGSADYSAEIEPPALNCFIGDAQGLLSDNSPSGRIA